MAATLAVSRTRVLSTEGADMGHANAEGTARVGARVEPPVSLQRAGAVLEMEVSKRGHWLGLYEPKSKGFNLLALVTDRLPGISASASGSFEGLNTMLSKMRLWKTK